MIIIIDYEDEIQNNNIILNAPISALEGVAGIVDPLITED